MSDSHSRAPSPWAFASVAFAFLITMLGTTMPTPLYPIYQQQYGFSQLIITVIFAVYAVGVMGALIMTGRWSDQLGRKPLLFAGLIAAALSDVLFLVSDGLGWLLVARLISGISAGIFTATATVAVMEMAPKAWWRLATFVATAVNMGGLGLGPIVAGLQVEYLPWPLHLTYAVHFLLCLLAVFAFMRVPESVERPKNPKLRMQRLYIPPEVRGVFLPAAIAGFAGFAMLGFFTATAPAFMSEVLGYDNLALSGLVAGSVFLASTLGQLMQDRIAQSRRLPVGCMGIMIGAALVGGGIGWASLAIFLSGALIAGLGHGIALRAGLGAIAQASPADQRASVTSSFFIVSYIALSIPVLGIGLISRLMGLASTGIGFAGFVALTAALALVVLLKTK